jgi:mono/diheme cytochrome c family protein
MKGTGPEERHLYPSFPYGSYQRMRVDDVRDLFAFIRTLPEVPGRVRDHELKFPYSIRRLVGVWKRIYLDGRPFVPEPTHSAEWNRGAYLVNGPGHCAECHSPRTALGGIRAGQRFSGGPDPEGKGFVPNITQAAGGLAKWSVTEIEELLARGFTPEFDVVGGQMAAVVRNTGQLAPADRHAIAVYVKSLPPVDGPPKPAR